VSYPILLVQPTNFLCYENNSIYFNYHHHHHFKTLFNYHHHHHFIYTERNLRNPSGHNGSDAVTAPPLMGYSIGVNAGHPGFFRQAGVAGSSSQQLPPLARSSPQRSRTGRRSGSTNYSTVEVFALLGFVEDVLPLGKNHWVDVTSRYSRWAAQNGHPARDHDSLMDKFRKLSYTKKPTGDPLCPADVRKAKHLAQDILAKAQAVSLGAEEDLNVRLPADSVGNDGSDEDGPTGSGGDVLATQGSAAVRPVGIRPSDRRPGARGIRKSSRKKDHGAALVAVAEVMAKKFGDMADAMTPDDNNVQKIVEERIAKALEPTNTAIAKLFLLLEERLPGNQ